MPPIVLVIAGGILMGIGFLMLWAWMDGRSRWFDSSVFERKGASKNDRQFLDLYFIVIVLAPLFGGAVMFVYGLRRWL